MIHYERDGINPEFYEKAGRLFAGEMDMEEAKQFKEFCKYIGLILTQIFKIRFFSKKGNLL